MKSARLTIPLLVAGLFACSQDSGEQPQVLPEAFHGTWELVGTSGGIAGVSVPVPAGERPRIVLTTENVIERHGPDGEVTRERFTVRRGKTIFSEQEQWILEFADGAPEVVVEIHADGNLGMSDNVYDGYSSSFRRIDE